MRGFEERRKRGLRIGAIVAGVLIVISLVVPRLVDVDSFRPKLEAELTNALGRQVSVGKLSLGIFSGSVTADNISIADDPAFSNEPFVTAKLLTAGVNVMPLIFSRKLHITGITLDAPQITLLRGAGDKWNFSSLGGGSATRARPEEKSGGPAGGALAVDKLNVDNGRLLVGTANAAEMPQAYEELNLEVSNFSTTTQFPFTLTAGLPGGGDFKLVGKCGPMNAGAVGQTPFETSMLVRRLDFAASGFVAASTGIQGLADFEGTINSSGQQLKATGILKAEKLKLAAKGAPSKPAITVKYAVDHDLNTDSGALSQFDVMIGKALMRLTGSYQMKGPTTALNLKVNANDMPLNEIEAALPAVGVVLPSGSKLQGGSLSADLVAAGPTNSLVVNGSIRMSNAKLAGFDLGSKLSAIPALSGKQAGSGDTTIQNLSTDLRMAPDGTQANAINLIIPSLGAVTGAGTVDPSGALNFNMSATLENRGSTVPFAIEGTTSDPKFVPNVKAMAGNVISRKLSGGEAKAAAPLAGRLRKK